MGLPHTVESINARIAHRGITLIGGLQSVMKKAWFRCPLGHEWEALPCNVLAGSKCGKCAKNQLLNKEVVNERIAHLGIVLIGDYKGGKTKTLFRCNNGHEFMGTPSDRLAGDGCRICSGKAPLTVKAINEQLAKRGLKLIGGYKSSMQKALFKCTYGHEWTAIVNGVRMGNGCPVCGGHSPKYAKDKFYQTAEARLFKVIGEYKNTKTPVWLECPHGHRFSPSPSNFVNSSTGCPTCKSIISYCFDPNRSAVFYMYNIVIKERNFIGYGISNNFDSRHQTHLDAFCKHQVTWNLLKIISFKNGHDAKNLELLILRNIPKANTGILGFKREATDWTNWEKLQALVLDYMETKKPELLLAF